MEKDEIFARPLAANEILPRMKRDGYCLLKGLVRPQAIDALRAQSEALYASRSGEAINIMPELVDGSYFLSMRRLGESIDRKGRADLSVAHHPAVKALMAAELGPRVGISTVIYDFRQPSFEGELFPLHWDHFRVSPCVKLYVHLDDVKRQNGAMRVIPGTHSLIHDVLEANGELTKIYKSDYDNTLEKLFRLVDTTPREVLARHDEALARLEAIRADPDESYRYVVEADAGDAIVFDPMALHGGGLISGRSRHIFRIHYVDVRYVNRYLPEQMQPHRFALWKIRNVGRRIASALGAPSTK